MSFGREFRMILCCLRVGHSFLYKQQTFLYKPKHLNHFGKHRHVSLSREKANIFFQYPGTKMPQEILVSAKIIFLWRAFESCVVRAYLHM